MKKGACILVLVLFCVGAGPGLAAKPVCMDGVCQGNEPNTCPEDCVGGDGDDGSVDIPVCVRFDDLEGDKVMSDGSGLYCDGVDGIDAFIHRKGGSFRLETRKTSRQVKLSFPGCDDPDGLLPPGCLTTALLLTLQSLDLRTLNVGDPPALMNFQIAFPSELSKSTPHLILFGGSNLPTPCGDFVTVTRTTDIPATWTLESLADDNACLFEVLHKNGRRELTDTNFPMPFLITIEE